MWCIMLVVDGLLIALDFVVFTRLFAGVWCL